MSHFAKLKNSKFLIVKDNSKVVGYIISTVKKTPNKVVKKAGIIKSFYVSKNYRNKGVGKELYHITIDWFKKQKCDHVELDVYYGNNKTISMYKKWGFKENLIKMKKRL